MQTVIANMIFIIFATYIASIDVQNKQNLQNPEEY